MSLRDDLSRILAKHSVTEVTQEMSQILGNMSRDAFEQGEMVLGERLESASSHFWEMEDFGV